MGRRVQNPGGTVGRKLTTRQSDQAKTHIKTSMILKRLGAHIDKECMSASQIQAAKILLAKVLPDLKAIEAQLDVSVSIPKSVTFKIVKPKDK